MSIAPRLRSYLDEQHAQYDVIPHVPTTSSLQSAIASHVPAEKIAKGVLLDTDEGYLLAVLPANHRIMLSDLSPPSARIQSLSAPRSPFASRARPCGLPCNGGAMARVCWPPCA